MLKVAGDLRACENVGSVVGAEMAGRGLGVGAFGKISFVEDDRKCPKSRAAGAGHQADDDRRVESAREERSDGHIGDDVGATLPVAGLTALRAVRALGDVIGRSLLVTGLVLLAVVAFGLMLRFVMVDGGSVIFTVLMSWFAALAMGPPVDRLSRHMRRGVATILVMLAFVAFVVVFVPIVPRFKATSNCTLLYKSCVIVFCSSLSRVAA